MSKFIRKSKRELYQNPWLTFEAHEVVHPNGQHGEHGLVVPPRASGVVVLDGDDVLLTRQERFGVDRSVLEIVKGGADECETVFACAQRETREELGAVARSWEPMGLLYEIPSIVSNPIHLYLARDVTMVETQMERVESIVVERLPFTTVLEALAAGEINDAVTGAALFRAAVRLDYVSLRPAASGVRSRDARVARAHD
jgi:8-oxo-dGTP pyrophosphatase MutT (NUDIX family)